MLARIAGVCWLAAHNTAPGPAAPALHPAPPARTCSRHCAHRSLHGLLPPLKSSPASLLLPLLLLPPHPARCSSQCMRLAAATGSRPRQCSRSAASTAAKARRPQRPPSPTASPPPPLPLPTCTPPPSAAARRVRWRPISLASGSGASNASLVSVYAASTSLDEAPGHCDSRGSTQARQVGGRIGRNSTKLQTSDPTPHTLHALPQRSRRRGHTAGCWTTAAAPNGRTF